MATDDIEVTEENFGELLIEALIEARAIACGDAEPACRVRRPMIRASDGGAAPR